MSEEQMPQIGKDPETQELVKEARENFPNLEEQDAVQQQANMSAGREAEQGEGQPGIWEAAKEEAKEVVHTIKQANPGTRDFTEKHC